MRRVAKSRKAKARKASARPSKRRSAQVWMAECRNVNPWMANFQRENPASLSSPFRPIPTACPSHCGGHRRPALSRHLPPAARPLKVHCSRPGPCPLLYPYFRCGGPTGVGDVNPSCTCPQPVGHALPIVRLLFPASQPDNDATTRRVPARHSNAALSALPAALRSTWPRRYWYPSVKNLRTRHAR